MNLLRKNLGLVIAVLAASDGLCIFAALVFAVGYTLPLHVTVFESLFTHTAYFVIFVLFWYLSAIEQRLWGTRRSEDLVSYMFVVTRAVGDAMIFSVFVMALFTAGGIEREFLATFCLATLVGMLVFRVAVRLVVWELRRRGRNLRRILLVGANDRAVKLAENIRTHKRYGYEIAGFLENDADRAPILSQQSIPHLGPIENLEEALRKYVVDEVFISLPVRSCYGIIERITHFCEGESVPVRLVADLFPLRIATSRLMHMEDIPLLSLSTVPEAQVRLAVKRIVDFVVSSLLLLLLSPAFALVAILTKLDSQGPIFFLQERVGQNQRRFRMIKFRSMVVNAEELRKALEAQNEADGPVFKIRRDPRVTRVGHYLRRFSIDEFPQLINVWKGEMSLVGPRPPIPSEVAQYTWDQRRRLSVRPGMTGLWQVSGRSDIGFKQWVEMDLAYIDNWSLFEDFTILFKTFRAVVRGKGAA